MFRKAFELVKGIAIIILCYGSILIFFLLLLAFATHPQGTR